MATENLTVRIGANIKDFEKKMSQMQSKLDGVGKNMQNIGAKMSAAVTLPLLAVGGLAVKTGMDFDDSMAKVAAISGATGNDLEKLRQKAKDMGSTTKFSASEAADGLNYMALAGWSTQEMLDGLGGIMNLAAASGEELGTVSDIVTDALSAFGLEAKDSGKFADVLAAASANANTDVAGLGSAFQYVAPVAGALGYTVEDTAQAIGLMANNGIKGEKAGTALRTMMTNLASPTKAMQTAMDELGISITDSDGNMKSLDTIMQEMRGSFQGLDKDQQAAYASTIFGKEAMSGALAIINSSTESYDKLGNAINNSEGAAQTMAETMESTLGGTWREIKSGLEGLAISIYESLLPALSKIADKALEMIQWLNSLSPKTKQLGVIFGIVAAAIGPLLAVGGTLLIWFGALFKTLSPIFSIIGEKGLGGALRILAGRFSFLLGPVGIVIGVITTLGTIFGIAYAKSETFRNIVNGLIERFKAFIPTIVAFGQSVFNNFMNVINPAIQSVKSFFISMFQQIKAFWKSDGETMIQAFKNGVAILKTVISVTLPIITTIFKGVFSAVLFIVKSVWQNIKGVIQGGLNIIMGIIRVFSGLFTGDFSKMWEGIKQIFKGAIQFVWNFVQLMFYGKIIKGGLAFIKIFTSSLRNMWSGIVNFFKSFATSAWQNTTRIFGNLYKSANQIFSNMVRSIFGFVKNILSNIKNTFNAAKNAGINIFQNLLTGVKTRFTNMVNAAKSMGSNVKDFITSGFKGAWSNAKAWIGKLVSGVKGMKDDVVQAAKDLAKGLKKHAIGGLNKMIDGVNWVGDKLGMGDQLIAPIKFSRGTQGGALAQNTLATVGDRGPGNGRGADGRRETVVLPSGEMFLTPNIDTQMMLPKGTKIFNGRQTQQMAEGMFSRGTGQGGLGEGLGWIKDKASGIGSKIVSGAKGLANKVGDVWDYMKNPGKLLDLAMDSFGVDFSSIAEVPGKLIKAGYNKLKDGALKKVKGWFEAGGLGNGKKASFMGYRQTTPYSPSSPVPGYPTGFNGGRHYGVDFGTPIGTPVHATLAGTVSKMHNKGGGLVAKLKSGNITQFFMHLSDILKTGAVKPGELFAKTGNSGAWTTGPHIHWQAQKGSDVMNKNTINPRKVLKGYANGGIVNRHQVAQIGEEGPEAIIPLSANRRGRANNLYDSVGKAIGRDDGKHYRQMIENQQTQIDRMDTAINVLLGIEDKSGITDEDVGKAASRFNNKSSQKRSLTTGRPRYEV